jgi:uncharacterized membrane protein
MSVSELSASVRRCGLGAMATTHAWSLGLYVGMVVWWASLFAVARADYLGFRLAKYDLGNMVQAVWSTAHGRPLEVTSATGEQTVRLASHVDPVLALLAPLWLLFPTPLMLLALQIAVVALGALPVFWLARRHLESEQLGLLMGLAYLAYPWLGWNALDHVHPVTLALPLLLFGVWFLDCDRLVPFGVCAGLAMLSGELIGVTIAALGIWYAVARRRRAGLVIAAAGTAWSLFALYVVVPAFSGGQSVFYGYYESVGGSPAGVVETAVTSPQTILAALTDGDDIRYVVALALPLAGLFLLSPGLAAVALPQMTANALSDSTIAVAPSHHYSSVVIPFLVGATVFGLARLPEARRAFAVKLVLVGCVGLTVVFGAWPGASGGVRLWSTDVSTEKADALRAAVALVPHDAPVSATNRVASHLSARRHVYTVPTVERAEWIVIDEEDTWIPWIVAGRDQPALLTRFLRELGNDEGWRTVMSRDGVFVFRRAAT